MNKENSNNENYKNDYEYGYKALTNNLKNHMKHEQKIGKTYTKKIKKTQ